mmetsp:Transcript_6036/g.15372  ORF Transcript_6036/g.15372 Transcript_6036/m.15372 type:complete len:185 (-) Transcript_6036:423-977(-)
MPKFRDALEGLSSSSDEDDAGESGAGGHGREGNREEPPHEPKRGGTGKNANGDDDDDVGCSKEGAAAVAATAKGEKGKVSFEDLKRCGYLKPSIMLVPEDQSSPNGWQWSDGRSHSRGGMDSTGSREANRGAANELTELAVKRSMETTAKLKELRKQERKEQMLAMKSSKKRKLGQAAKGDNQS